MALDEYDKFRKKFNTTFRKVTKSEVDKLSPGQQKIYKEIVANENIAAVPKDKSTNDLLNSRVRLREFDSETFKPVSSATLLGGKRAEKIRQSRRDKANEYKTDMNMSGKGYDTESGMYVPKRKPRIAPREEMAQGGKVCRGRTAAKSAEKTR
jgi:hypothetical protein